MQEEIQVEESDASLGSILLNFIDSTNETDDLTSFNIITLTTPISHSVTYE